VVAWSDDDEPVCPHCKEQKLEIEISEETQDTVADL
jgi:hypothetical protein